MTSPYISYVTMQMVGMAWGWWVGHDGGRRGVGTVGVAMGEGLLFHRSCLLWFTCSLIREVP